MKIHKLYLIIFFFSFSFSVQGKEMAEQISTKKERNYIREGNSLYNDKRYAEAEIQYRKALEEVPTSETALFNLAVSLIRQSGSTDPNNGNNPVANASQILNRLATEGYNLDLSEKSFYNLGNIAFNNQDYSSSIELYKNALRKNPDDDKARQNLRIAQKKLEEQQNQQDNNKDNQNQENQQEDKEQDKQDNQNNQQDKNKQDNQQDNSDQQNQNNEQQNNQNEQQRNDSQQTISDANMDKILKAMEKEESATRKRVLDAKKKEANSNKKKITNPW